MIEEIKTRYMRGVPENDLAAAYRADVGYLLSRLSSAENAIRHIYCHAKSRMDFMSNDSNVEER